MARVEPNNRRFVLLPALGKADAGRNPKLIMRLIGQLMHAYRKGDKEANYILQTLLGKKDSFPDAPNQIEQKKLHLKITNAVAKKLGFNDWRHYAGSYKKGAGSDDAGETAGESRLDEVTLEQQIEALKGAGTVMAQVRVIGENRPGFLADVTQAITAVQMNIISSSMTTEKTFAVVNFMVEIERVDQLHNLHNGCLRIDGVREVTTNRKYDSIFQKGDNDDLTP